MSDLASRIAVALNDSASEPWFPELTQHLTAREWKRLEKELSITPETYSTARVLQRDATVRPQRMPVLSCGLPSKTSNINVEAVDVQWASVYQSAGICFYSSGELKSSIVMECIGDALQLINKIPTLSRTVHTLVRSFHIIKPFDSEHDLSFSEPHIPFSIFFSVMERRVPNDALRVAEAIIHESMHLQLTLIEHGLPIVRPARCKHFSPWKQEKRGSQSLLHALYVFTVVDRFFSKLREVHTGQGPSIEFVRARREEMLTQIRIVRAFARCQALTPIGRRFVANLLRSALSFKLQSHLTNPEPSS